MSTLLQHCASLPVRDLSTGDVLLREGERNSSMYVVAAGTFNVSRDGSTVAEIDEPGAVLGEIAALLDTAHGATVTATSTARVHVIDDPETFIAGDEGALLEIARTLAGRLNRLVGYLADVKQQYGDAGGHLGLLDDILTDLAFGEQPTVEPGSERDPDPIY